MVAALFWLGLIPVGVLLLGLLLLREMSSKPPADHAPQRAALGLYAIRRRLEVRQFKTELRRDAAYHRRALRHELQTDPRRRSGR